MKIQMSFAFMLRKQQSYLLGLRHFCNKEKWGWWEVVGWYRTRFDYYKFIFDETKEKYIRVRGRYTDGDD